VEGRRKHHRRALDSVPRNHFDQRVPDSCCDPNRKEAPARGNLHFKNLVNLLIAKNEGYLEQAIARYGVFIDGILAPVKTIQHNPNDKQTGAHFINAVQVAQIYGVTSRFILQLAAEGKIPCLRLAKKCVRFESEKVAEAFKNFHS
jgi:hypothetical protein